jgi:cytochrome c-type biogenesis protein CcmH
MTLFVTLALLLSLLAGAFLALPLLRARGVGPRAPWVAVLCTLLLTGAGAGLYITLGDRGWSDQATAAQSDQSISILARELERDPQNLQGWLNLGQNYADIGRYSMAQRSYERANRLAPGGNAAALAGIAESMLLSGDSALIAKAPEFLARALQLDPQSPKALFYSAVSAYQQGRLDVARERFAAMLALSPPENVRAALQKQIEDIDAQMRNPQAAARSAAAAPGPGPVASVAAPAALDAATAIHLHVTLAPGLAGKVPADASLFVFVRSPDGGAPLAVKRSSVTLPQDVELSAADAMVAGHGVQPGQNVAVVARISVSGSPLPQSGDLYGEISTIAGQSGSRALQIDRLNP